ncbi:hypothetical protein [Bradyrhizobium sp. Bra64]|uniref:hypothetical protein n=1 Tax=Bradyrhizobium sp. Bra64 TaxID=2926009 RepID=UPI002118CCD8|nr:hypothetical protein [Bradyrhizobium sp. Bra64]
MGLILSAASGTFISTADYFELVRALLDLHEEQAPFASPRGRRDWIENEIKLKLGLVGDIWPAEIRGDLVIDGLEHAERRQNLIHVAFPQHRAL